MALTGPRWIAIAVASALVAVGICFSRLSRPEPAATPERALQIQSERLSASARSFATKYRVLQLRDSLRAKGRLAPESGGQTVIVDARLDGAVRLELNNALLRANTLARIATPRIPTVIAFVLDTAQSIRGVPQASQLAVHYLLPRDSLHACTVLVRVGRLESASLRQITRRSGNDAFAAGLLGPCAFYAAFGEPGVAVERWLRSTGFAFALDANWSVSDSTARHGALHYLWVSRSREQWQPGDDVAHCLAGHTAQCSAEMQAPRRGDATAVWGDVVDQSRRAEFMRAMWRGVGATFLSDMVRDYGEDKFARFWRSDQPVAEAFRQATAEDLGTAGVRAIRERFPTMETGPDMSSKALLNGLALLTLGLIGTFAAAARTRVA